MRVVAGVCDIMAEDNFPERVDYCVQQMGGVRAAARKTGISTTQLDNYRSGGEPSRPRLVTIAESAGVDLLWLATGRGQPDARSSGFVSIPIFDVRLAAGTAKFEDGARRIGEMPFDLDLLRGLGKTSTDGLGVLHSDGDSMEPLIADGARVVVDFRDTRLREGVFAFRFDSDLRIKRLRRVAEGIEVISENPRYSPELLAGQAMEHFAILGRTIWSGAPL